MWQILHGTDHSTTHALTNKHTHTQTGQLPWHYNIHKIFNQPSLCRFLWLLHRQHESGRTQTNSRHPKAWHSSGLLYTVYCTYCALYCAPLNTTILHITVQPMLLFYLDTHMHFLCIYIGVLHFTDRDICIYKATSAQSCAVVDLHISWSRTLEISLMCKVSVCSLYRKHCHLCTFTQQAICSWGF